MYNDLMEIQKFVWSRSGHSEIDVCICGNDGDDYGFFACNEDGNEISPDKGSDWKNLYVCGKCGRIINGETFEVVGRNQNVQQLG